jgi:23S rRNA (cytidine2498-2'-O)-methyltransferase
VCCVARASAWRYVAEALGLLRRHPSLLLFPVLVATSGAVEDGVGNYLALAHTGYGRWEQREWAREGEQAKEAVPLVVRLYPRWALRSAFREALVRTGEPRATPAWGGLQAVIPAVMYGDLSVPESGSMLLAAVGIAALILLLLLFDPWVAAGYYGLFGDAMKEGRVEWRRLPARARRYWLRMVLLRVLQIAVGAWAIPLALAKAGWLMHIWQAWTFWAHPLVLVFLALVPIVFVMEEAGTWHAVGESVVTIWRRPAVAVVLIVGLTAACFVVIEAHTAARATWFPGTLHGGVPGAHLANVPLAAVYYGVLAALGAWAAAVLFVWWAAAFGSRESGIEDRGSGGAAAGPEGGGTRLSEDADVRLADNAAFIITAAAGLEAQARQEVRRILPEARAKSLFLKGNIIAYTDLDEAEALARLDEAPTRYLSHIVPFQATAPVTDGESCFPGIAEAAARIGRIEQGERFIVRAHRRGQHEWTTRALERAVAFRVQDLTGGIAELDEPIAWQVSLQVFQALAYIGINHPDELLVKELQVTRKYAPGERPLNRAQWKMREALKAFAIEVPPEAWALDLGSAPGGWAAVLAERAAHVVAVDPAELDPSVTALPNVEHLKMRAEELLDRPDFSERFDLLTCDMNVDPAEAAALLVRLAPMLKPGAPAIMTVKYMTRERRRHEREAREALSEAYEDLRFRHLPHNARETTVAMRRK